MAIPNPFKAVKKSFKEREQRKRRPSISSRCGRSPFEKADPQRRPSLKMSAGTKRARIARQIDRLQAEGEELDSEWSKLYGELERAATEHERLSKNLQSLFDVEQRQTENCVAQETLVGWLMRLCTGKRQRRGSVPKMPAALESKKLKKKIERIGLRKDHIKANVQLAASLMRWIEGEIRMQKAQHTSAESDEDGNLSSDEFLPEVLEERRTRRQTLRKRDRDESRRPTTQDNGFDFFSKMDQGKISWKPSSSVFSASQPERLDAWLKHSLPTDEGRELRDYMQQHSQDQGPLEPEEFDGAFNPEKTIPGQWPPIKPFINITPATLSPYSTESLQQPLRRLSLKTAPAQLPLPCAHKQWLPRPSTRRKCDNCRKIAQGPIYYCPKCPAEICVPCFRAGQPNGGQVGISSRIFPKGTLPPRVKKQQKE